MQVWIDRLAAAALRGLGTLSADTADRAGAAIGLLAFHLGVRRKQVSSGLALLGWRGTARRTHARRSYCTMGASLLALWTIGQPRGAEPRPAAMPAGIGGAVLVIGHTGMWLAAALAARRRWPGVLAYFKPLKAPAVQQVFIDLWRASGVTPLAVAADGGRDAVQALRALRNGQAVGLAADQEPGSRRWVPGWFLGQPCRLHAGPASLALRARVPVVVGLAVRRRAGVYQVVVSRPLTASRTETELSQAIADRLGALIAAVPGQHFWHHRRFKRPAAPELPDTGRWNSVGLQLLREP
jgi:lauroyl/myristoyl acyltransferase